MIILFPPSSIILPPTAQSTPAAAASSLLLLRLLLLPPLLLLLLPLVLLPRAIILFYRCLCLCGCCFRRLQHIEMVWVAAPAPLRAIGYHRLCRITSQRPSAPQRVFTCGPDGASGAATVPVEALTLRDICQGRVPEHVLRR